MSKAAVAKIEALEILFHDLESVLRRYSPPFASQTGTVKHKSDLHLSTSKEVMIAGRKKQSVSFASIILQRDYVGFYFMPIYTCPDLHERLSPVLLRLLRGQNCFHIKEMSPVLHQAIEEALEIGKQCYAENGWL
jgi:hypothetical protein